MKQHLETMARVLNEGIYIPNDRTGKGRLTIFGAMETYDLTGNVLPLLTSRKLYMTWMTELFGMIGGHDQYDKLGTSFWKAWTPDEGFILDRLQQSMEEAGVATDTLVYKNAAEAAKNHPLIGRIGPMYGKLWRQWPINGQTCDFSWIQSYDDIPEDRKRALSAEFDALLLLSNGTLKNDEETRQAFISDNYLRSLDQLNKVFLQLKRNPWSSHHRVTAFNPALVGPHADPRLNVLEGYGALSPCHPLFQFHVHNTEGRPTLDCQLYMGSSDVCLGRPYNVAFYSLLTIIMAHCLDYNPGKFTLVSGNTHIYGNHIEQAREHIKLRPLESTTVVSFKDPTKKDLFAFTKDDIVLSGYEHLDPINYAANV